MAERRLIRVHQQLKLIPDLHVLPCHELTYYKMRAVAKVVSEGSDFFLFRFNLYAHQYLKLERPQTLSGVGVERAFDRLGYVSGGRQVLEDLFEIRASLPTDGKIIALGTTKADRWAECLRFTMNEWERARVPVTNGYYLRQSDLFVARLKVGSMSRDF